MKILGLDIGSTYIKCALLEDKKILQLEKSPTTYDPLRKGYSYIKKYNPENVVVTGYGRKLLSSSLKNEHLLQLTEIKACAIGAKYMHPKAKTIIDIGGQDTKVIKLNKDGKVIKFEMNDKCSAGTGRFLEIMVKSLGYSLEEIQELVVTDEPKIKINSMCTVFAESEVISMAAKGISREEILKAVHYSISQRIAGMLKRIGPEEDIILAGGLANNRMLKSFIQTQIKKEILIPDKAQFLSAIGSALYGLEF